MERVYEQCLRCGGRNGRRHRWCRECQNRWNREHRRYAELAPAARQREIARALARVYRRRGHLVPEPCELCGAAEVEMHHDDYSRPLAVRWVCRSCHRLLDRWRARFP